MKTPSIETRVKTQANIEDLPILLNAIRDDLKIRDVDMANLCRVSPHTLATWRRAALQSPSISPRFTAYQSLWSNGTGIIHNPPIKNRNTPPTTEAGYFEFAP